jgi:hypothetical protein
VPPNWNRIPVKSGDNLPYSKKRFGPVAKTELSFIKWRTRPASANALTIAQNGLAVRARRERDYQVVFLVMALTVVGLSCVLRMNPRGQVTLLDMPLPPSCSFRMLTGKDCAGCGLTRCFVSLAHGDLPQAWQFNPAGFLVFAAVVAQIPYRAAQLYRIRCGWAPWRLPGTSWFLSLLVAALLIQWLWRAVAIVTG